jgi:hypothetical protein
MEDVPPGTGYLPPEYQALVAGGYDEVALLLQALEASKEDEDDICPGYSEAIKLTCMVANHLASLPPPPPPPPHERSFSDYEGQEVPPLPGILRRQRRHDHPQWVVINPPSLPPAGGRRRPRLRRRRVAGTGAVAGGLVFRFF